MKPTFLQRNWPNMLIMPDWKEMLNFLALVGIALFLILILLSWLLLITACLMGVNDPIFIPGSRNLTLPWNGVTVI